jgi:type II secretory ATPase GspE/PulE/Tfp pilus assembly ATPase PilB-like protein
MSDTVTSKIPRVATAEATQQFSDTMRDIRLGELEREAQAQAAALHAPYISLVGFPISSETLVTIPEATAAQLQAICFFVGSGGVRVGARNPADPAVQALAREIAQQNFTTAVVYLISQKSFDSAFKLYAAVPKVKKFVYGVEITAEEIERFEKDIHTFRDLADQLPKVSVTDMLTLVIAAGLKARSSDIHIEAEEHDIKIRFRIDGLLHDVASLKPETWHQFITRIKLVSALKINVADRPQDGRFTIFLSNDNIDVRVSCLPTAYGESVVMRLLMSTSIGLSFEDLGIRGKAFEQLKLEIQKPNGMIVTTGPTGSGKTTTLYAVLRALNDSETKIITIEDPIEYKLEGVNQSQVNGDRGYTFANGLRSIVRQDPDVIMVGEIRDLETGEIAINAAQTGHLVLTTLHTNDAAGTVPRFLAIGVKPYLLAPAINAMIGQRLVRRICPNCKKKHEPDNQTMSRALAVLNEIPENSGVRPTPEQLKQPQFFVGGGCEQCQGLGYKGRIGIYEIMIMNKEVEKMILGGQISEYDMREIGTKNGTVSMVQDGLLKAIDGITTVDEVFRVAKDVTSRL